MQMKSERTFTMGADDIKTIVAEHLTRTQSVDCTPEMVVVHIKDSTPYGGQFDEGNPAVLTVTATIDETSKDKIPRPNVLDRPVG